jgi:hypothetical protein
MNLQRLPCDLLLCLLEFKLRFRAPLLHSVVVIHRGHWNLSLKHRRLIIVTVIDLRALGIYWCLIPHHKFILVLILIVNLRRQCWLLLSIHTCLILLLFNLRIWLDSCLGCMVFICKHHTALTTLSIALIFNIRWLIRLKASVLIKASSEVLKILLLKVTAYHFTGLNFGAWGLDNVLSFLRMLFFLAARLFE